MYDFNNIVISLSCQNLQITTEVNIPASVDFGMIWTFGLVGCITDEQKENPDVPTWWSRLKRLPR